MGGKIIALNLGAISLAERIILKPLCHHDRALSRVERDVMGQARRGSVRIFEAKDQPRRCSNCSYNDEDEQGKRGDKSSHHPHYKTPGRIHSYLSGADRILHSGLGNRNS